jgi:hypothetical protein
MPQDKLYWTLGVFLGIVVRCGLPQPLPFAPLVYKIMAGEKVEERDVLLIDDRLKASLITSFTGDRSLFRMRFQNGPGSFDRPDKDMCFLSILVKRLILISPQIHPLAIVSRLLLGIDAARFAWHDGVT